MNILARKTEPTAMTPARSMAPPMPRNLHPAAQEAAAVYSDMLDKLERATEDNQLLRNDIEVERRTNVELRRLLDAERRQKEQYMRYAVEVKTHLTHIAQVAIAANERAMDCAEHELSSAEDSSPKAVDVIETEIGKIIAENVAARDLP